MTEYLIINLHKDSEAYFSFNGLNYYLSPEEVTFLIKNGSLLTSDSPSFYGYNACHRCRKHFLGGGTRPTACPHCHSETWNTYTLLYCCECHALFEYYWHPLSGGNPYDRFPRCPACKSERWCPAENERLKRLPSKEEAQAQAEAKRQTEAEAFTRLMELRKQQQWKKMGLGKASSPTARDPRLVSLEKDEAKTPEGGAAIIEAEAFYKSMEGTSYWLNKGSRPVESLKSLPKRSTPPAEHPTPVSERSAAPSQFPIPASEHPTPPAERLTSEPRRGILSVLRNWFRHPRQ